MKTTKFFILVISLTSFLSWSQDEDSKFDSLKITKSSLGYNFYSGNTQIYKDDFRNIISKDHAAFEYFRKGNNMNALSTILSLGAGFGIGWLVGGMLAGGEPNWIMGGVGAGLLIFSIPLSQRAQSNFNKSVTLYNKNLSNESNYIQSSYLKLTFGIQEIGLKLTF